MSGRLTDKKIRAIKPSGKVQRFFDGGGLFLQLNPQGTLTWYLKYYFQGKERRVKLGNYPYHSLAEARRLREETKAKIAHGRDPAAERQQAKEEQRREVAGRLETVARDWHRKQSEGWTPIHSSNVIGRLENHVFPWLGEQSLQSISPQDVLKVIERIEKLGARETASRVLGILRQVFSYGMIQGLCTSNPCIGLHQALTPHKVQHMPAVLDPVRLGQILRMIDAYEGGLIVKVAMQLAPLLAVRPGELRQMRWEDVDLDKAEWRRVVSKVNEPLLTPLARQSVELLRELYPYTKHSQWVFPSPRDFTRPLSNMAVTVGMKSLGIDTREHTQHGWRSVHRTLADEVLRVRVEVIEMALGHTVRDALGRSYNRTSYLDERRELAQRWADYLDSLKQL